MLALFDLDNTLIDRSGTLDAWAEQFVQSRRLRATSAGIVSERLRVRAYPRDFAYIRDVLALNESVDQLWREYVDGMASTAHCLPGVHEGLCKLRNTGWTACVVTNGAIDIQTAKFENAELAPVVRGICISEQVGARKPSKAIFEKAAALCGAHLGDGGWMIGDNPETDMRGGASAGLRTIWIANGQRWDFDAPSPDVMVENATEAIAYLLDWSSYSQS